MAKPKKDSPLVVVAACVGVLLLSVGLLVLTVFMMGDGGRGCLLWVRNGASRPLWFKERLSSGEWWGYKESYLPPGAAKQVYAFDYGPDLEGARYEIGAFDTQRLQAPVAVIALTLSQLNGLKDGVYELRALGSGKGVSLTLRARR